MSQTLFLEKLIAQAGSKKVLAEILMHKMQLSKDAVYRRLRGSTALTIDEIGTLSKELNFSLDQFFAIDGTDSQVISFEYNPFSIANPKYVEYFSNVYKRIWKGQTSGHITYVHNTIPYTYISQEPSLLFFSAFFLTKFILGGQMFNQGNFSLKGMEEELSNWNAQNTMFRQTANIEVQISSSDIWHRETGNGFFDRIRYATECGFIEDQQTLNYLCDALIRLFDGVEYQAEVGHKTLLSKPENLKAPLRIYLCDAVLPVPLILVEEGDVSTVYTRMNEGDYLATKDEAFVKRTREHLSQLIKSSAQISETNERLRSQVFTRYREQANSLRSLIK